VSRPQAKRTNGTGLYRISMKLLQWLRSEEPETEEAWGLWVYGLCPNSELILFETRGQFSLCPQHLDLSHMEGGLHVLNRVVCSKNPRCLP